jgi:hypothetical protein
VRGRKLKKKIFVVIMMLGLCFFAKNVTALEKHWAEEDLRNLKDKYKIEIMGNLDQPADKALQEKIFKLMDIKKRPLDKLLRFRIFYYMVESLSIETLEDKECNKILQDFEDTCNYCKKANRTLGKAKKVGLLKGRRTPEGLVMVIDKPVTRAELGVLAVRYMKLKDGSKK